MPKHPRDKGKQQRWMTFLRNHKDGITAMDFFVVPTITFRLLYMWFIIDHERGAACCPGACDCVGRESLSKIK